MLDLLHERDVAGRTHPIQGTADREDGRQELYRAAFIRLNIDAKRLQRLALGAFNCRVTERQA